MDVTNETNVNKETKFFLIHTKNQLFNNLNITRWETNKRLNYSH